MQPFRLVSAVLLSSILEESPHRMSELSRFIKAVAPLRLKRQADVLLKRLHCSQSLPGLGECVFLK